MIKLINALITDQVGYLMREQAQEKTYALVQSLKLLLNKKESQFYIHGQKILCITYTNAAANEIKERLGNTPLILVSTIHERMWGDYFAI